MLPFAGGADDTIRAKDGHSCVPKPAHRGDKIQGCWNKTPQAKQCTRGEKPVGKSDVWRSSISGWCQMQQSWCSGLMISFPTSYIFFSPCHHLLQHPYSVTQTDRRGINFTLQVFSGEVIFSPGTGSYIWWVIVIFPNSSRHCSSRHFFPGYFRYVHVHPKQYLSAVDTCL